LKSATKTIYLSFDDGPNPIITEKVLEILKAHNAKASFFCKGINAELYPEILEKIKLAGHTIGNHSYSHKNALKTSNKSWLADVLQPSPVSDSQYFRPPYGKIFPWQFFKLKKRYKIVFWDVITMDYRSDFSPNQVISIIKKNTRNGSILVFHDTTTAAPRMFPALEETLTYFADLGFGFEGI
jgi:peptidoglycan/xylan/chitin deacetylase (PgdA/CDA1 family)